MAPGNRDLFATRPGLAGRGAGNGRDATRKAWIPATNAGMTTMQVRGCRLRSFGDGGGYHVKQSVNRWSRVDRWSRIALAAVLTSALGLAACGRKGPLDPPPSAGLASDAGYTPMPTLGGEGHFGLPAAASPAPPPAADAAPAPGAPPPPKKTFFLDFLLGK
jgi:predicted small lipoprotein YifL